MKSPHCVICGGSALHRLAQQPMDWEYDVEPSTPTHVYACEECGCHQLHPRPTIEDLVSFYPPHYHAYNDDHGGIAAPLVSLRSRMRAKALGKLTSSRPVRLFDVGTGDCRHFKDISRHLEVECFGCEINPKMVETAGENGYSVFQGSLEEMDISGLAGSMNVVTMYQLVEHVLDPRELLDKAWTLLKPGGYVLGQLPCMDSLEQRLFGRYWAGYHYPRHLQMITRKGMATLLEKAGFTSAKVNSALHLQAGLSLQNALVGGLGWRPRMHFGKVPGYSALLLLVAPFCLAEHALGRGGMMNFSARKPPQP